MSLDNVYDAMCAYVTGSADQESAAMSLFGGANSKDARRLAVYRNNYRGGLSENLAKLFWATSRVVRGRFGKPTWSRLVDAVAARGPLPNLRLGGAVLVDVLAGPVGNELGLPAWLAELANVEVTQRRILLAPDVPLPTGRSLNPVLALLECRHDIMRVRAAPDPTQVEPREWPNVVAVWRTADGDRMTRVIGSVDIAVLRYIQAEKAIRPQAIADGCPAPTSDEDVRRSVKRLERLQLLIGSPAKGPRTSAFDGRLCGTTTKGTTP